MFCLPVHNAVYTLYHVYNPWKIVCENNEEEIYGVYFFFEKKGRVLFYAVAVGYRSVNISIYPREFYYLFNSILHDLISL